VGDYKNGTANRTLVEHWNGKAWKIQRSPSPRGLFDYSGVAATSATNAWAVGDYITGSGSTPKVNTLTEHWNGRAWKVQPSRNPTHQNNLTGVAATSPDNAWTVGSDFNFSTLIEHWNGKAWKVQPSPNPSVYNFLHGVAATSAINAWAVGNTYNGDTGETQLLVEHWNGRAWKVQPSPNPGNLNNVFFGVAATSRTNALAVGYYCNKRGPCRTLLERWNGKAWKVQNSPNPSCSREVALDGVASASSREAWTVGTCNNKALIEHWNGKAWTVQHSHLSGSRHGGLAGVAATSARNAWAVGHSDPTHAGVRTLIERWNGNG
jgi:hypothetical protein